MGWIVEFLVDFGEVILWVVPFFGEDSDREPARRTVKPWHPMREYLIALVIALLILAGVAGWLIATVLSVR
jgi:hypothetical protein